MTPLEACDPVFLKVCELNSIARIGTNCPDYQDLRGEMVSLIGSIRQTMVADSSLERHWSSLELPLIFFTDSMISESNLPVAAEWNRKRLAYERKELAGDQKFFDLMNATLADSGVDATARLPVYYTCIGLGFLGFHAGHPEQLQKAMNMILERIDPKVAAEASKKITPEAYDHVDIRNLIQPPPIRTSVLVALFFGLALFSFVTLCYLIEIGTVQLRYDLKTILKHSQDSFRR